jgi:hypothetical protein
MFGGVPQGEMCSAFRPADCVLGAEAVQAVPLKQRAHCGKNWEELSPKK